MAARLRVPIYALLAANTLSFIAESIAIVAIPWFVFELTGSAARVGLIGFFTVLPRVVATFLGGQVVDRIGFRISSIASDVLSGLSVLGIPILYASGNLTFGLLVALVFIGAMFDGPGATAREAMVPELTADARMSLDRVNAFFQGSRRLSSLIGPVVAGFLVAWVGASNVLWVNAVVFALSAAITVALIPGVTMPGHEDERPHSFWANTLFGFRFIRQHRLLVWLAGLLCLMNFLDAPMATVAMPALVREHYGSVEQLGVLLGMLGGGAVIGTVVFSAIAPRLLRRRTFIAGFFGIALSGVVTALAPPYPVLVLNMIFLGLAVAPLNPILMSIRQERVPMPYRARVFGTTTAIAFVAIPLGQLVGGYLIEWMGVRAFLGTVAAIHLVTVASFIFNPVLHEMDQKPLLPQDLTQPAPLPAGR
ncbi:MAG: MFS transporter [Chloroflexota bacterium]|nr:MFS transporter [Chloroflexota bacterium]